MKSIIDGKGDRRCYICGSPYVHKHHIYGGPLRKVSEANGFTVDLCPYHHNMSDYGVHFDKALDLELKELCQKEYEKNHTRKEWMNLIGKNYL